MTTPSGVVILFLLAIEVPFIFFPPEMNLQKELYTILQCRAGVPDADMQHHRITAKFLPYAT